MRSIDAGAMGLTLWRSSDTGLPAALEEQLKISGFARLRNVLVCDLAPAGYIYHRALSGSTEDTLVFAHPSSAILGDAACFNCERHATEAEGWAARVFDALKDVIAEAQCHQMTSIILTAPCFRDERIASAFGREGIHRTGYSVHVLSTSPPAARPRTLGKTVEVAGTLPISYPITNIDAPIFDVANPYLSSLLGEQKVLAVVDRRVMQSYGKQIRSYFSRFTRLASIVTMSGDEAAKNWANVHRICRRAVTAGLDRSSAIVAIGGGVVMDVAGVAATLYRRGIPYIRVPTTLIGIVDVGVGIKHAFNFMDRKNAMGSFYPPTATVADRRFLRTLDVRHVRGGLAEILKIAIVRDAHLFELVEASAGPLVATCFAEPASAAEEIILRAQTTMAQELANNLFERDKKRLADFGHTFSPLLEVASGYALHHGEAVAVDMMISAALALLKGMLDARDFDRIARVYDGCGIAARSEYVSCGLLLEAVQEARSHRGGALNLVLPTSIGSASFVQDVSIAEMEAALSLLR